MHTKRHRKLSSLLPHANGLNVKFKQSNDSIVNLTVEVGGGIEPYSYNWQIISEGEPDHTILSTLTSSQLVIISNFNKSAENETKQTNLKLQVSDASGYSEEYVYQYITHGYEPLLLNKDRPVTASYCGFGNSYVTEAKIFNFDFLDNIENVVTSDEMNSVGKSGEYFDTIEKLDSYFSTLIAFRDFMTRYTVIKLDYENREIPKTSNYTFSDYLLEYGLDYFLQENEVLYEIDPNYNENFENKYNILYLELLNRCIFFRSKIVNINIPRGVPIHRNTGRFYPEGSSIYSYIGDIKLNFIKPQQNISAYIPEIPGKIGDIEWRVMNLVYASGLWLDAESQLYQSIDSLIWQNISKKDNILNRIYEISLALRPNIWCSLYLPLHRIRG